MLDKLVMKVFGLIAESELVSGLVGVDIVVVLLEAMIDREIRNRMMVSSWWKS